jgi:glycosyltransferase involved in cell wall biosynthesis
MKFSIVIPCYNEEHNLPFLLSSIKKLNYPKEEFEVIVVDNNCTDRTVEIAKSFNVDKIVREKNQGLTWARQRGFLVSDGQIIYDVDADCELTPEALKIIEKSLADPKVVAVSGPYDYHDLNKFFRILSLIFQNIIYPIVPKIINLFFRKKAALIIGGNTAIKREALYKIKGFDTSVKFWGEDALLAFRLANVGKVIFSKKLKVYTSGRRFKNDGYLKTTIRYFLNYFWLYFFNKPFVKE